MNIPPGPVIVTVLSIPLIFEKIPRNRFYGFRTIYTRSSDAVWYRANKFTGKAMLCAGVFWLAAAILLPSVMAFANEAATMTRRVGIGALATALAATIWQVYRPRPD